MDIVCDSPEHRFLTFLEKTKNKTEGWNALRLALSEEIDHDSLIENLTEIPDKLRVLREKSRTFLEELKKTAQTWEKNCAIYQFTDGDLILVLKIQDDKEQDRFLNLYKDISNKLGADICEHTDLSRKIYDYQKLADKKFLSARKMKAYEAMADENRVSSIPVRRKRRKEPMVMIVEDDRFTASYAANVLNKEYDLIHTKTGEEAIVNYIEHAPDMVFLDIHLPGLNGHGTLHAIKRVDPKAYVVMLSVDTVKTNITSASKRGAAGFLKKPFTKDRLLFAVKKAPLIQQKTR